MLKSLESAGADGVYICHDMTACQRAFNRLLGTRNKLNIKNKAVFIQLDSFFEAVFYAENGQKIGMTKDVFSQPGTVYRVHPDLAQIESDYAKIRNMELAGIYLEGAQKTAD